MASGGGVTSEMVLVVSWHGPDSCPWVCCSAHSWASLTCSNWPTAPRPLPVGLERLPGPTSCCPIPQQHQHLVGVG